MEAAQGRGGFSWAEEPNCVTVCSWCWNLNDSTALSLALVVPGSAWGWDLLSTSQGGGGLLFNLLSIRKWERV